MGCISTPHSGRYQSAALRGVCEVEVEVEVEMANDDTLVLHHTYDPVDSVLAFRVGLLCKGYGMDQAETIPVHLHAKVGRTRIVGAVR